VSVAGHAGEPSGPEPACDRLCRQIVHYLARRYV